MRILKKLSEWPKCIDITCKKLEPHRIAVFLYELAYELHSYWNLGKDNLEKRFLDREKKISNNLLNILYI